MPWQVKCLADNLKSLIPFSSSLRRFKHQHRVYRSPLSRGDWTLQEGLDQLDWLVAQRDLTGSVVLEVGSGWEPIIPLLFAMAGAKRVYMTDLNRLCSPSSLQWTLECLIRNRNPILSRLAVTPERFTQLTRPDAYQSFEAGLRQAGLYYLAPCDCRNLSQLESGSIDIVTSRAVLEHIPGPIIDQILAESYRLLAPGGLCCHFVDTSDHWQHNDPAITRVNFLRFSEFTYRLTSINKLNYHNRFRHPDYVQRLQAAGFALLREERELDQPSLRALTTMKVDARFQGYSPEDLATTGSYLLGSK